MSKIMKYTLWYRKDEDTLQEYPLSETVIIGSSPDCTIKLTPEHTAPLHARLSIQDDVIFVTNLSAEGVTRLDGKNLSPDQPTRFNPGQTLSIGHFTFLLFEEGTSPAAAINPDTLPAVEDTSSPNPSPGSSLGEKYTWLSRNARWLGIAVWVGVLIVGIVTYFIISSKVKEDGISTETTTPTSTIQETTTPIHTPEFISPSLPTTFPVSTLVSVIPPGAGEILIEPITLLAQNINLNTLLSEGLNIGQILELSTNIVGDKIGFAYQFVAVQHDRHIVTIQKNYISAETTREIDGVPYPDWGTGNIPIKFDWKPGANMVSDGKNSEIALVYPTEYGINDESAIYAVDGLFIFSENKEKRRARAFFDSQGKMLHILTYKMNEQGIEAPYKVQPQAGDQFTILLEEFQFEDSTTNQATQTVPDLSNLPFGGIISGIVGENIPYVYGKGSFVQFEGGTLTFGSQGLTWNVNEKYEGEFYVGIAAEDLDGNYYAGYVPVLVKIR